MRVAPRVVLSVLVAASTAIAASPAAAGDPPRYHRAPLSDSAWQQMIGREVLLVLSTGYRVCGSLSAVDREVIHYEDPAEGARRAARSMVTAVHEGSWECDDDDGAPKVEWARPGAAVGLGLAGVGVIFGVMEDAGAFGRASQFAILGGPSLLLAAPIAGFAGRSTARDLRVRGLPWARISGWTAYGAALVVTGLWAAGRFGEVEALAGPGLATAASGLGLLGTGLLAGDALRSRREMLEFRRLDSQPREAQGPRMQLSVAPIGRDGRATGLGVGLSGVF
ncbi:MAG: hypothetical protein IPK80_17155 [Nannocystis sp.]|jgi:hypothetical protein|nr:hypothetical protein [Nannocystis sp.]